MKRKIKYEDSTSDEETEMVLASSGESDPYDECFENFLESTSKSDWIKCITCGRWLHESCTLYGTKCARFELKKLFLNRRYRPTNLNFLIFYMKIRVFHKIMLIV